MSGSGPPSAVARRPLVIAVDGPAASGKTTLARRLAKVLDRGEALDDRRAAVAAAEAIEPAELDPVRLACDAIGQGASRVAAIGQVRTALIGLQRGFGGGRGAVLAGRDIGTVVRPEAVCKIFVTASVEERARRRFEELQARAGGTIYGRVLDELRERDARDRNRAVAPLVPASNAFVIDTTDRDADQAFALAHAQVQAAVLARDPLAPAPLAPR